VAKIIYYISLVFLIYTYLGYAVLLHLLTFIKKQPVRKAPIYPNVSVVVAVWNEEQSITKKILNILSQNYPRDKLEVILVSDGSTDKSPKIMKGFTESDKRIRLYCFSRRRGKAAAINMGISKAKGEIIILTDSRQLFTANATMNMVSNFADPMIGAVSGELFLKSEIDTVGESFSSYWDYEKWIRKNESSIGSVIGVTGAVCGIRRYLYDPIPENTILDDLMIPMRIIFKGYRVIYDENGIAYDDAPIEYERELKRKCRTLTGNFQILSMMPEILSIRKNNLFWQYFSHKICRLLAPLFIILLLISNMFIANGIFLYLLAGQITFYILAFAGLVLKGQVKRHACLAMPTTFIMLNYAVCVGFMNHIRRKKDLWI
jgi:cellulose synthase/poly-beta-1,6-N-acetylglucosamine synthase-like glycosyltransferase